MPTQPSDLNDLVVALVRAVNLAGARKLAMKDLAAICTKAGFSSVRTFIQSGNVLFRTPRSEAQIKSTLERALTGHMGATVEVLVRTMSELDEILRANPFPKADPARVAVVFFDNPVPKAVLDSVVAPDGEEVVRGTRELYIHYPNGMGRSKLKYRSTDSGTARNVNTVRRLLNLSNA